MKTEIIEQDGLLMVAIAPISVAGSPQDSNPPWRIADLAVVATAVAGLLALIILM